MVKNIKYAVLVLLAIITFTSGVPVMGATQQSGKPLKISSLKTGMSKGDVQTILNRKPDGIVATKNYSQTDQIVEVVQYSKRHRGSRTERYWLYFLNDQLQKCEIATKGQKPQI